MRLWILTESDQDHDSALKLTQELVESVYGVISSPLSTAGAHAAQTVRARLSIQLDFLPLLMFVSSSGSALKTRWLSTTSK